MNNAGDDATVASGKSASAPLAEALAALDVRPLRIRAAEWPGDLAGLDSPGLYAWWVDEAGAAELGRGLEVELRAGRIYVGQAGAASSQAGIPSAATLRSRIGRNHLGGRVRSSTLRRTLAGILAGPLGLRIAGEKELDEASEDRLSAWMAARLSLAVWPAPSDVPLGELEKQVVQALEPPLNRGHLPASALGRRLRERRALVTHGIDDLYMPPDPDLGDWRPILGQYGQAFDGYRYAELVRRRDCPAVADDVWRHYDEQGRFASSFADLRCALFWLQRCVHSAEQSPGWQPDSGLERRVQLLYRELLESWARIMSPLPPGAASGSSGAAIQLPSQAELDAAAAAFERDWGGVDEALCRLCREHPAHDDRRAVTAKLALIDRAYSAGLERRVSPPPGEQAITVIADFCLAHASAIDDLVGRIASLREPLTTETMAEIVEVHGCFTRLLQGVATDGKAPRSFAAKYLHFHHPVVPIYDSYAADRLIKRVRWDSGQILFERPDEGDPDYWDFCVRFLRLYEACLRVGLDVTVKSLDTWLWQVPKAK